MSENGIQDAGDLLRNIHQSFYGEMVSIEDTQRAWRQILHQADDEHLAAVYQPFLNDPVETDEQKTEAREALCRIRGGDFQCTRKLKSNEFQIRDALMKLTATMGVSRFEQALGRINSLTGMGFRGLGQVPSTKVRVTLSSTGWLLFLEVVLRRAAKSSSIWWPKSRS